MAYVPATVLLGKGDELILSPLIGYGASLVGVATFALAYLLWRSQLDADQSAGH